MADTFITLVTYTYNTEAVVLVAKLEAEGIKCFLKNEHLLSTQQFLSNAVGGLDVQVSQEDFEKAKQILEEHNNSSAVTSNDMGKDYEKVLVYCPQCESTNVYKKKSSLFSFGAKEHVCVDCQYTWKQ
ncbi:MAG: hypothetical protein K0S32_2246 [Bacteroidetes bacterium]|jgi:hypothetical protein|nr:hypothetical protein [Bacteroidota bacterium]